MQNLFLLNLVLILQLAFVILSQQVLQQHVTVLDWNTQRNFSIAPWKEDIRCFNNSQDIETAIATLCDNANGGLHDSLRSYTSVINVDFSNDLYDSENGIIFGEFPKSDESGEYEIEDQQSLCEKLKEL